MEVLASACIITVVVAKMDGMGCPLFGLLYSSPRISYQRSSRITLARHAAVDGALKDNVLIVAGISLKNLKPRVWDPASECYLPKLGAIMVSYAEIHQSRGWRDRFM